MPRGQMLLLAAALAASTAAPALGRTWEVGAQRDLKAPSDAAAVAGDGDIILIDAGVYRDCAEWRANNLVIQGKGIVLLRDKICRGKAIFVVTGDDIIIRGIQFSHARSPDKNGAGILSTGANLTIENSRFTDNENGLLTSSNPRNHLRIRDSFFSRNGKCEPWCAHGIYAGRIALLQVFHSTFVQQMAGHHIKSRAMRTEILGNSIRDGDAGTASYAVDLPDGGALILRDNVIEKGPAAINHLAAVSVGEESHLNPTGELVIDNNVFVNDNPATKSLVHNLTATKPVLNGNRIRGGGALIAPPEHTPGRAD